MAQSVLAVRHSFRAAGCAAPQLSPGLVEKALPSGRDRRCGRAQRCDGWTPARIRTFLDVLARTGSVAQAAGTAGMSRQSAYALRASGKGRAFDDAWRAALLMSAPRIPDEALERAINGQVEPIFRGGKLWGERHRFDNRLAMQVLRHLDKLAESRSPYARALRAVEEEFDSFLDIACACDDEALDAFLRSRCAGPPRERQVAPVSTLRRTDEANPHDLPTRPASPVAEPSTVSTLPANEQAHHDQRSIRSAPTAEPRHGRREFSPVSTLPAARPRCRRTARGAGFVTPTVRRTGARYLPRPPPLFAPADHFASAMKLYRVRSFFPPGQEERGFRMPRCAADSPS